jgi:hypothetical protein
MHRLQCFIAILLTAACSTPVAAAVYRVGGGAGCTHASIQAAIDVAEASTAADDILISGASYANQTLVIDNAHGALTLIGGYANCQSMTPTPGSRTVVSGSGAQTTLTVLASPYVALLHLDIQNGHGATLGGGIRVRGGNGGVLRLFDTLVRGNQADRGGGIAIENSDGAAAPDQLQLLLEGDSRVLSNAAGTSGGGIHCQRASVTLRDTSHIGLNMTDFYGGGIYAQDCRIRIGSRGLNGAVLWSNTATSKGGGLYVFGTAASVDIYTADPLVPARVVGNGAGNGAGIAVLAGASVTLHDAVIAGNTSTRGGGAVLMEGDQDPSHDTHFAMQAWTAQSPADAAACADAESCNLVRDNRAISEGGVWQSGVAIQMYSGQGRAHALFRGTRLDRNEGRSLAAQNEDGTELVLDGALAVGNRVVAAVFDTQRIESPRALVIRASTIADNGLGDDAFVIVGPSACADIGGYIGTHVYRSIIREEGHTLIHGDAPQSSCFMHLLGNDFGALPATPERVVADPAFVDAANGDYRVSTASPALDFAPAEAADATRDGGARVFDLAYRTDLFGPQDLGAYEYASDRLFADGFDGSGNRHASPR